MSGLPAQIPARAVVFAYHDIGVRCLEALLELGLEISLVVTHTDQPSENIWFASVAAVARKNNIPVIAPEDPNTAEIIRQVAAAQPQFLFSFYYRTMLGAELLNIPPQGAFNMHGSLLPRYRGRVPVNWAIINGEHETGVSFHRMVARPDAGNLVAQQSVPILLNDTAHDIFRKLVCACRTDHSARGSKIDRWQRTGKTSGLETRQLLRRQAAARWEHRLASAGPADS